ncbi:hypothetical protein ASE86_09565 [Sphingomonas sp. Leaf33]|uniref:hypothetical protein n=1 Tax=Sphingomonas sp. Leaf33 TaxID=1736215 RepID=UPI0006FA5B60|nr:hypothetical protein [Sphingomonas sp. Leaf33]KQN26357.1 hypothetical protein ASE86_09565 [Sphingomonas sp. Leaf33]
MPKVLSQFSITQEADGYVLHVEDEDGDTTEYSATLDQIDDIAIAIEDLDVVDEDDPALLDADDEERTEDED